jgi:hypothetical protein
MSKSTNRNLPDDQVQIENKDEYEEAELQTMERAMDLSKQFEEVKQRTVEDGMVHGKLVDIQTSANNDRIVVEIDLPAEGDTEQTRFRKPKRWSDKYNFVRWIKYYDYTADSFPNMVKDHCKVEVKKPSETGDYELFVPERERGYRDRIPVPSIPPIYTSYKESKLPIFQWTGLVSWVITTGFTLTGTIHLMPTKTEETMAIIALGLVLLLIGLIEDHIQRL